MTSKTRNKIHKIFLKFGLWLFLTLNSIYSQSQNISWQKIDSGLFFSEVLAPLKSDVGDSKVTILKIDPQYYNFKLISAKEKNEENKTLKEWARIKGLIAAINAGLYQEDNKTNVGYLKNFNFINNNHLNKDNTIAAFNREYTTVPEIQIIDLKCQKWDELKDKYNSYTQCIRMIDCEQKNTWRQQQEKYAIAVIAIDKQGNALFIFTRSPYSVHDFINILKLLPLNIYNAMYLEGSIPASFYLNYKGKEVEKTGSIMTNGDNGIAWELPNIIGIVKKN
jgi:uncharacterized protein YigE (DUF2233 family)